MLFIPSFFLLRASLAADDHANLWGKVLDEKNQCLEGISVHLRSEAGDFEETALSDSSGLFFFWGIPAGSYTLDFQGKDIHPYLENHIVLQPGQFLFFEVIIIPSETDAKSFSKKAAIDYTSCLLQTVLNRRQIQDSPSAHNIWSLVENQDLSATTNHIDVGGLWGSFPALFSTRGSCSWTQNIYLLNGLDVTDPYWTGMPLIYPDFFSLDYTRLTNAGFFSQGLSPGGYFELLTGEETTKLHGRASIFFIPERWQDSNISSDLEKEGITESHGFNRFVDGNLTLSGPIIPKRLLFFSSFSSFHISRDLADYEKEDEAMLFSGLISLKHRSSLGSFRLLWTGQVLKHPSFGAGRHVPFSSTLERKDAFHVFQLIWSSRFRSNHFFNVGICYNQGTIDGNFQEGFQPPHGTEILKDTSSGLAPYAHSDERSSLTFLFRGDSLIPRLLYARHRLRYGCEFRYCSSLSRKDIADNLHLRFHEGNPLEAVFYNTPVDHRESALHLNLFAQDALTFSNFITAIFGFHLVSSQGWVPEAGSSRKAKAIQWLHLSPRLGLVFPLAPSKNTALKLSVARYYFTLPLYYLTYGNPNALGGMVYTWMDNNNDRLFQEGEAQLLIRREGPLFSEIDPELKRPYTDEFAASFHHAFGKSWHLTFGAFFRESRHLVETLNIGVPFSCYKAVDIYDIGDDRIPNTHDDLTFSVYNQNPETLGQDFLLLTNPEEDERMSRYYGFDLTLVKKYGERFSFFLSLTATSATGITNPGNTEWENDDGVVGRLYDDPNTLINAKGRMRFDRAYTGRIGLSILAPFDLRIGCLIKYYDGQPFARKIMVEGMNQGPFYIQAHPRGVARYEYNRTVDLRLEKIIRFKKSRVRVILDGFNILNRGLATEENEWTGPEFPLRFATEIQSPRVFRLGVVYEF
jgi:hypothetical protein